MKCYSVCAGKIKDFIDVTEYSYTKDVKKPNRLKNASFQLIMNRATWLVDPFILDFRDSLVDRREHLLLAHTSFTPETAPTSLLPKNTFLLEIDTLKHREVLEAGDLSARVVYKDARAVLVCWEGSTFIQLGESEFLINKKGEPVVVSSLLSNIKDFEEELLWNDENAEILAF